MWNYPYLSSSFPPIKPNVDIISASRSGEESEKKSILVVSLETGNLKSKSMIQMMKGVSCFRVRQGRVTVINIAYLEPSMY